MVLHQMENREQGDYTTLGTPLHYAKAAVETMMRKYEASKLPPEGHFHYHQGVFLSGVYQTWLLCHEERYFQYIKDWVDHVIDSEGEIHTYDPGQLDDIQPGILLFPLYHATGEEKYKKAMDTLAAVLETFPRIPSGGFWHKKWYPEQMWLDGLYMAGPFSAQYGKESGRGEFYDMCAAQVLIMRDKTEDKDTGLWYHAYDDARKEKWADPVSGRSPEFWGRSIGWVPVAVLDELDFLPEDHPHYGELCEVVKRMLEAVCRYQSEEGIWYQVVDKAGQEGNWPEVSCSCLYVAAICKAVRRGILSEEYMVYARKGYEAVIRSLSWEQDNLLVGGVCIGTGVGDYEHYCNRPVSENDLHGMGAFLLMCTQMQISEE